MEDQTVPREAESRQEDQDEGSQEPTRVAGVQHEEHDKAAGVGELNVDRGPSQHCRRGVYLVK